MLLIDLWVLWQAKEKARARRAKEKAQQRKLEKQQLQQQQQQRRLEDGAELNLALDLHSTSLDDQRPTPRDGNSARESSTRSTPRENSTRSTPRENSTRQSPRSSGGEVQPPARKPYVHTQVTPHSFVFFMLNTASSATRSVKRAKTSEDMRK